MKKATTSISIIFLSIFLLGFSNNTKAQLDTNDFVITWKTNNPGLTNDSSITISTDTNFTYNFDIDWDNDGFFDTLGISNNITHQFPDTGIYTIRIRGDFPSIQFGTIYTNSPIGKKIISLDQWGNQYWKKLDSAFINCTNLGYSATDIPNLDSLTSLESMFSNCIKFNGAIGNWDVSNVKTMSNMFAGSRYDQPLNNWDVSSVTDMGSMFANSQFNQILNNWDVSSVTNMSSMFANSQFNQILNNWNVSKVTRMTGMFGGSRYDQPLNSWNVSSVTNMHSMFSYSQFNHNLNNWAVSSVTDMRSMFKYSQFNQNLINWDISSVTDMRSMFANSQFNQNLGDWSFNSLVLMHSMLSYSKLSKINYDSTLIGWQTKPVPLNSFVGANHLMFCNGKAARDLLISNGWNFGGDILNCDSTNMIFTWQTVASGNVTIHIDSNFTYNYDVDWDNDGVFDSIGVSSSINHQFNNAGTYPIKIRGVFPSIKFYQRGSSVFISLVGFNQWGNIEIKNLDSAFTDCSRLFFDPIDELILDSVTSLQYTFKGVSAVKNITNWDVSNVTNMSGLFSDSRFNQAINAWNVSNVTDMNNMFYDNPAFNLPLNSWDVSSVVDMSMMFRKAWSFNQSIDSFDVSKVRDMSWMFSETSLNQSIDNWDVSSVVDMSYMFSAALDFDQPLNSWDVSNVFDMTWMFNAAINFNQPLNNWDVSKVTRMNSMFNNSFMFNQPLNNWDVSKVTGMNSMFNFAFRFDQNLGSWDINAIQDLSNIINSTSINVSNYDSTLIGWQSKTHPSNLTLGAIGLKYCLGEAARDTLITDGWTILGDSKDSACIVTSNDFNATNSANLFKLYPNPSQGMLFIEIDQAYQNTPLLIYNQVGQIVKETRLVNGKNQIDLSDQAKGVYFVRYGAITEKLILID